MFYRLLELLSSNGAKFGVSTGQFKVIAHAVLLFSVCVCVCVGGIRVCPNEMSDEELSCCIQTAYSA